VNALRFTFKKINLLKAKKKMNREEEVKDLFYLGECTIEHGLRMEDASKNKAAGSDAILGMLTSTHRTPEQSCAICYYDSNDEEPDDTLEAEFVRKTTQPIGRYGMLCVVENDGSSPVICKVCSHVFHSVCLYKWIKTESGSSTGGFTCPVCRGGLHKQHLDGIPELFLTPPEYVVKFWDNGKKKEEYFELGGKRDGIYISYYLSGYLELECGYVAGLREGREKHYYDAASTMLKSEVDFHEDKKSGISRWYTSTGRLIGEAHYLDGHKHGSHIEWYTDTEEQRLRSVEHHLNGKRHGIFMKWSFQGQLLLFGVYVNDEKDGRFCAWYEEHYGLKIKEFFVNGVKHGKSAEYYEPTANYPGLVPKEVGYYDHGMRVGLWRMYWSNGQLKSESEYNAIGQRDGMHREWNRFGRPFRVFRFDNDELDGVCETYDDCNPSIPIETATYRNGQLHGLYVSRYKNNGKPKIIKVFKHQKEVFMKWLSRNGDILSQYQEPHTAPTTAEPEEPVPEEDAPDTPAQTKVKPKPENVVRVRGHVSKREKIQPRFI
jgi:antitoxin component YwqK of YwqJK toxin-antitoxin module